MILCGSRSLQVIDVHPSEVWSRGEKGSESYCSSSEVMFTCLTIFKQAFKTNRWDVFLWAAEIHKSFYTVTSPAQLLKALEILPDGLFEYHGHYMDYLGSLHSSKRELSRLHMQRSQKTLETYNCAENIKFIDCLIFIL